MESSNLREITLEQHEVLKFIPMMMMMRIFEEEENDDRRFGEIKGKSHAMHL